MRLLPAVIVLAFYLCHSVCLAADDKKDPIDSTPPCGPAVNRFVKKLQNSARQIAETSSNIGNKVTKGALSASDAVIEAGKKTVEAVDQVAQLIQYKNSIARLAENLREGKILSDALGELEKVAATAPSDHALRATINHPAYGTDMSCSFWNYHLSEFRRTTLLDSEKSFNEYVERWPALSPTEKQEEIRKLIKIVDTSDAIRLADKIPERILSRVGLDLHATRRYSRSWQQLSETEKDAYLLALFKDRLPETTITVQRWQRIPVGGLADLAKKNTAHTVVTEGFFGDTPTHLKNVDDDLARIIKEYNRKFFFPEKLYKQFEQKVEAMKVATFDDILFILDQLKREPIAVRKFFIETLARKLVVKPSEEQMAVADALSKQKIKGKGGGSSMLGDLAADAITGVLSEIVEEIIF
ncbi:MAG: hypothetical protein AB1540_01400 [Bdellovibrionota bacterium]